MQLGKRAVTSCLYESCGWTQTGQKCRTRRTKGLTSALLPMEILLFTTLQLSIFPPSLPHFLDAPIIFTTAIDSTSITHSEIAIEHRSKAA